MKGRGVKDGLPESAPARAGARDITMISIAYASAGGDTVADILIRGLNDESVERLRSRAKRHGRSLQSEARRVLDQAAGPTGEEIAATLDGWKRHGRDENCEEEAARSRRERRTPSAQRPTSKYG